MYVFIYVYIQLVNNIKHSKNLEAEHAGNQKALSDAKEDLAVIVITSC